MALKRVSEPAIEPVSLAEAKEHLRVDTNDQDDLIEAYISAARSRVERSIRGAVAEAPWELTWDVFPDAGIEIPMPPLIAVQSVKYDDVDGVEQTVDSEDYFVDTSSQFGWVVPIDAWPEVLTAVNAVRVRFTAGYVSVPHDLRMAIMLLMGQYYENRAAVAGGSIATLPNSVEALIEGYRIPVIA